MKIGTSPRLLVYSWKNYYDYHSMDIEENMITIEEIRILQVILRIITRSNKDRIKLAGSTIKNTIFYMALTVTAHLSKIKPSWGVYRATETSI
jgi:hypothetical protein